MTAGTFVTMFVVGLIAAWLAASYVKVGGYGLIWDMVLALVGSALAYGIVRAVGHGAGRWRSPASPGRERPRVPQALAPART
jgi:uncharacterized membrane protein YeaQ/YmgE (transglycosylase-associated protein family)